MAFREKTAVLASEDSMVLHCIVTPGLRSIQQRVILKRHYTPCDWWRSRHLMSRHVTLSHVILCHVLSSRVFSCHTVPGYEMSRPDTWQTCHVLIVGKIVVEI